MIRIAGSFGLIGLAVAERSNWFLVLYIVLAVSDLIDGPIARFWNQSSKIGAALDSLADIVLSACLIVGVAVLHWETLQSELWLIGLAFSSYIIGATYCYRKFKRLPAFHTYAAKITHLLVAFSAVSLLLEWSVWPLRVAALAATATNLELLAICTKLSEWRTDVPSIFVVNPRHQKTLNTGTAESKKMLKGKNDK